MLFPMDTLKNAGLNSTSIVLLPLWNYLMEHWRRWRPAAITAAIRTRERGALIERRRPVDLAVWAQVLAAAEAAFRVVLGVIGGVHQDRRDAEEVPLLARRPDLRATVTRASDFGLGRPAVLHSEANQSRQLLVQPTLNAISHSVVA